MTDDRTAQIAALVEQGATAAEIAVALEVSEVHARRLCRDAGFEPALARRGRPPIHPPPDRTIRWRVSAAAYRALTDYADRLGVELHDAIAGNLIGQCWICSEPAILDARDRPLCEACCERTGRTEAPTDAEADRAREDAEDVARWGPAADEP